MGAIAKIAGNAKSAKIENLATVAIDNASYFTASPSAPQPQS